MKPFREAFHTLHTTAKVLRKKALQLLQSLASDLLHCVLRGSRTQQLIGLELAAGAVKVMKPLHLMGSDCTRVRSASSGIF
jgi:hypothetical protein